MALDPYAGLIECPVDDCEPDDEGWAHGVEHVHVVDLFMVREADVTDPNRPGPGPADTMWAHTSGANP